MPKDIKCVLIFKDNGGTGWSEIHYRHSSSDAPDLGAQLSNLVDNIVPSRGQLLGNDCQVIGARVSYERVGAVASIGTKFFLGGPAEFDGVSSALSLPTRFVDSTRTRGKTCHLRGFWDAVEQDGEYHPELVPGDAWTPRFNDWKAAMIANQYGWLSKDAAKSAKGNVTNYIVGPDGHVTFTLSNVEGTLPAVGTQETFRFSRLNNGSSPLNSAILVNVVDATHVVSVKQFGAGPFLGIGRFNYRGTSFVAYSQVYSVALGRRPQGRPFFQLPGRGPVRKTY